MIIVARDLRSNLINAATQIEHMGIITEVLDTGGGRDMTIGEASPILDDCHIGDSIAVNGACLTVTKFDGNAFTVGLANETLRRTDLGDLVVGDHVNLERAMAAYTRFGGHFVQGHVDGTAKIVERIADGDSIRLTFEAETESKDLLRYIIEKGYVTIDGASLTITGVDDNAARFGVMLVVHTQQKITLASKKVGQRVNVEVDMVGKYVEKSVRAALGGEGNPGLKELVERSLAKQS